MKHTPLGAAGAFLLLGALAAPGASQDIFTCSSTDMILTRANDMNANNTANDPGEYTKCAYSTTLLKNAQDLKYTTLFGAPTLLWLDEDNSINGLVRLTDTNGDGVFEPSEISLVFGAIHTSMGQTSASNTFLGGMAEDSTGNIFITNNQFSTTVGINNTNGIYRMTNVTTTPSVAVAIQGSSSVTAYEDSSTPSAFTISGGAWEQIVCYKATDTFYAYNSKDDVIYALRDLDSDGKFLSAGEVVNFVNVGAHAAGLNVQADFTPTGSQYFNYGIPFHAVAANSSANRISLLYLEVDQASGALYVGTRTQPMDSTCSTCDISGIILKCQDSNANGTCNDTGEVTIYCDQKLDFGSFNLNAFPYKPNSSATPGFSGLGIDPVSGTVYCMVNTGPTDYAGGFTCDIVWKLVDLNSDGDVSDAGEQIPIMVEYPAGSFSKEIEIVADGIFSKPFPAAMNHEAPGSQSALPNPGCTSSPNLNLKTSVRFYKGPPFIGNPDWQISVTGTRMGSLAAQLWVSQADWDPVLVKTLWDFLNAPPFNTGLPYPNDLSTRNLDEWLPIGYWNSPAPMYTDIFDLANTGSFHLENVPGGLIGSTTAGVFTAGAPAAGDTIQSKCTIGAMANQPYIGRFDCNIAIPNVPFLAGSVFRFQWFTEDPQTASPPIPYAVSDVGIVRLQ